MESTLSMQETYAHKSIRNCIRMLAPFSEALTENISALYAAEDIIRGERQFYNFILELYKGMYANPLLFYIPAGEYDAYIESLKSKPAPKLTPEKHHATDARECRLRNTFQQSIQFYAKFFYELGLRINRIENGAAVVSADGMTEIYRRMESPQLRGDNEKRYGKLADLGIGIDARGDEVYISSRDYPAMFYGLLTLCDCCENKYKYMNYLRLDYKSCLDPAPSAADVIKTLEGEPREVISLVDGVMESLGLKVRIKPLGNITSGSKWKVEYYSRGKNVFGFYATPEGITLLIYFNDSKNITEMSKRIETEAPELFNWFISKFPERLCKCPYNRAAYFGGERRRICGMSNRAEIADPAPDEANQAVRVMKMFRNIS